MTFTQLREYAGEIIRSEIDLPELAEAGPDAAEVTLEIVRGVGAPPEAPHSLSELKMDPDGGFTLNFSPVGIMRLLPGGHRAVVYPDPSANDASVRHLIIDHLLPRRLSLSGRICLHGTSVAIGGRALAFVAASHQGKSTTTAALAQRGGLWLSDDCLLVDDDGDAPMVIPTFSGTRLWPDSSAAVGLPDGHGEVIDNRIAKLRWTAAAGEVADAPAPLVALIRLQRADTVDCEPVLEKLSAGEAIKTLGAHWHLSFMLPPRDFLRR
jgi:hypothetical protein